MGNSLNIDLTDKVVVLRKECFSPQYQDLKYRLFRVRAGFGAKSFTSGSALFGEHLLDGEKTRWEGYEVERLATDEEIASINKQ